MKIIKEKNLYKLFSLLSKRRKKEIYFFIILSLLNGISESLSISTVIPFLTLITSKDEVIDFKIINKYICNENEKYFTFQSLFLSCKRGIDSDLYKLTKARLISFGLFLYFKL